MNHILSLIFPSLAWRRLAKALVFAVLALSISACSSDDDDDDDANKAPTSNAGEDQSVAEGTTGVTLDGSGSSDSDGTIEKYAWTLTTSNDDVTLSGEDTATASFTAPDVDADTELVFRLTVTDNDGATDTDDVTITVTDSAGGTNVDPVADAGDDQEVDEGDEVALAGSGSDSDGTIASYDWALTTANDDVTLSGADTATASFTAPEVDEDTALVFRLTVTDNDGATATDDVTITIADTGSGGGDDNVRPTADAGEDQEVDEGDEVTLTGSGSDSDGTIVSYEWTHTTSNDGVELSGADTATASFIAPPVDQKTEYAFRLTVTDDDGATGISDTYVTVLDTDNGGGDEEQPSSQVLFASQYELIDGATGEPLLSSSEGGDVYSFSGGNFIGKEVFHMRDENILRERQLYGVQYYHSEAIDDQSYFGLTVKSPNNGELDISETDTLVIQMGNGVNSDTTHMVFVIDLNGGEQDPNDYSWTHSCSYEQELLEGSQPGEQLDPAEAWDNGWGVQTYRIPLVDFDCGESDLSELKVDLEEVAVKVVGGVDEAASAVADNHTLLSFGFIAFSNDSESSNGGGASEHVLFASQYELIDGATGEPLLSSSEGGGVYSFSGGNFVGKEVFHMRDENILRERQLYGVQYYHSEAIDDQSYFGLTVKSPNDGELDISETDTLVIQMGNGVNSNTTHMVFVIDLNGGEQDPNDYSWTHSCSYEQELLEGSQPGEQLDPAEAWDNGWGVQTYRIPLVDFDCGESALSELKVDLEEVAVKVVGGVDEAASAVADNHTLLSFGFIAFASDGYEEEDSNDDDGSSDDDDDSDDGDYYTPPE